jgi:hypothetical protein
LACIWSFNITAREKKGAYEKVALRWVLTAITNSEFVFKKKHVHAPQQLGNKDIRMVLSSSNETCNDKKGRWKRRGKRHAWVSIFVVENSNTYEKFGLLLWMMISYSHHMKLIPTDCKFFILKNLDHSSGYVPIVKRL